MKKFIVILSIVIIGSGLGLYYYYYGGGSYYTEITSEGKEIVHIVDDTKEEINDYQYSQPAFNENGDERQLTFNGSIGRPLKHNAFIKLKVNRIKGVVSWEEVTKDTIPEKALSRIKK